MFMAIKMHISPRCRCRRRSAVIAGLMAAMACHEEVMDHFWLYLNCVADAVAFVQFDTHKRWVRSTYTISLYSNDAFE